jgi:magnesium transporter
VLGTNFIATYHRGHLDVIDYVRESCADNFRLAGKSPGFIAFLIVERCVYECAVLNLANDNALELLEGRLTTDAGTLDTSGTKTIATNIRTLKKLASCLHIVLMALGTKQSRFVTEEAKETFHTLLQSALAVRAAVDSSQDLLDGIVNGVHARAATRTNEIVRTLTVMSGVLLPLSLIAGIYGMNFENIPELRWRWGYFAALGAMTAVGLALYAAFRRSGFVDGNGGNN